MVSAAVVRFARYISTKHNFLKASVCIVGLPWGIGVAVFTSAFSPWAPVISLILAPAMGFLWGLVMWRFYFSGVFARSASLGQSDTRLP